jgi:putative endonuclease
MADRRRGTDGTSFALCHAGGEASRSRRVPSRQAGAAFERHARQFLERQGLACVATNLYVRGGELDLVMREADGTLVFVEVRARAGWSHGGAAASIGRAKRRRIVAAALAVWARAGGGCACRFDVVAFEAGRPVWMRDAFRVDGNGSCIEL